MSSYVRYEATANY